MGHPAFLDVPAAECHSDKNPTLLLSPSSEGYSVERPEENWKKYSSARKLVTNKLLSASLPQNVWSKPFDFSFAFRVGYILLAAFSWYGFVLSF